MALYATWHAVDMFFLITTCCPLMALGLFLASE
jgi:hypothetical protein